MRLFVIVSITLLFSVLVFRGALFFRDQGFLSFGELTGYLTDFVTEPFRKSPPPPQLPPLAPIACQTHFTMAYVYVSTPDTHNEENYQRLLRAKPIHEEVLNKSGRGYLTFDLSYPVTRIDVKTKEDRRRLFFLKPGLVFDGIKYSEVIDEFYKNHPDDFDFITFFESTPSRHHGASHMIEQNTTGGIGVSFRDLNSYPPRRLLGTNFMGDVNVIYKPFNVTYLTEEQLACDTATSLAHETTHQWSAYVGRRVGTGGLELKAKEGMAIHWFRGLNIGYDPVGGARWQDNKDGAFTLLPPEEWCAATIPPELVPPDYRASRMGVPLMSDLTLYLAGAIEAKDVKPIQKIHLEGPLPEIGETIIASSSYVTIEDVINLEGKRVCYSRESPLWQRQHPLVQKGQRDPRDE